MIDEREAGERDGSLLDAGLRAAFGHESTGAWQGGGGVLATLEAGGVGSRVLLRDEPDEAAGIIDPRGPGSEGPTGLGRYQIAGEIARGGVGVVLRGRDMDLGREVALKVLRAEHADEPAMIRRLVEEAQIGGQLQHPGVLPVYEMGLDAARRPYFAMKVVRGRTFAALLQDRPAPESDRPRILTIFEQICQTVAYAHARGVIHRDLKPSNVMVGSFGEVQVVDWGLAKVLARGGVADERRPGSAGSAGEAIATVRTGEPDSWSEVGSVLGTPPYMAPEQARGEVEDLDERADVFALGAMLCEILTGRPPYEGSRAEVLRQAREGLVGPALARLEAGGAGADADLVALARRCLAPDRSARPRDAGQVARAVAAHLASFAARARAAEVAAAKAEARAEAERRARRRTLALGGGLVLALLLAGLGYGLREGERQRRLQAELASERVERARLRAVVDLETVKREQLDTIVGILLASEQKGRWIISQAASAPGPESAAWADLLGLAADVAERVAAGAPDADTRRKASELFRALRDERDEALRRASRAGSDETAARVGGNAPRKSDGR